MKCEVKVFNPKAVGDESLSVWLKDMEVFLAKINMDMTSAEIRAWEYGASLKDVILDKKDKCLDTGSYNTYIGAYLSQYVKEMWATDSFEWGERDYVKENNRPLPSEWETNVKKGSSNLYTAQADLRDLSFKDEEFDKIFCFSTIEHVPEDNKAIKELWRVLKPRGTLVLTTDISPHGQEYKTYGRIYTPDSFRELFKQIGVELPFFELPINPRDWIYQDLFTCISIILEK